MGDCTGPKSVKLRRAAEFKYYRLTDKGKKQLVVEESQVEADGGSCRTRDVARRRGELR
jgi:DNA-binding PadR family transcriptional regulator